jgi:hypothetical protein
MSTMGMGDGTWGLVALVGLVGLFGLLRLLAPRESGDPLERYPEVNRPPVPFTGADPRSAVSPKQPGLSRTGAEGSWPSPRQGHVPAPVSQTQPGFEVARERVSQEQPWISSPAPGQAAAREQSAAAAVSQAPQGFDVSRDRSWFEPGAGSRQQASVGVAQEAPGFGVPAARQQPPAEMVPAPPSEGVFAGQVLPLEHETAETPPVAERESWSAEPETETAPWSAEETWEQATQARRQRREAADQQPAPAPGSRGSEVGQENWTDGPGATEGREPAPAPRAEEPQQAAPVPDADEDSSASGDAQQASEAEHRREPELRPEGREWAPRAEQDRDSQHAPTTEPSATQATERPDPGQPRVRRHHHRKAGTVKHRPLNRVRAWLHRRTARSS